MKLESERTRSVLRRWVPRLVAELIFIESRTEDERHHAHETILEYFQKAPDDIQEKLTSVNLKE